MLAASLFFLTAGAFVGLLAFGSAAGAIVAKVAFAAFLAGALGFAVAQGRSR
ncbi:MAG: hypothetical protein ACU0CO_06230 [Shimia sp.]